MDRAPRAGDVAQRAVGGRAGGGDLGQGAVRVRATAAARSPACPDAIE